ncbi:MAG TPA: hypothetical protein VEZ17_02930 [Chitinophagaceae bacterium]|jgi:hypothetical protein|nr:hypothetical protein [Chitinophagaceae bacterium]
MLATFAPHVDDETINTVGLKLSEKPLSSLPTNSRVFEYPELENVFIMDTDLYGNLLPDDFCFLAFYGQHGLIGNRLKVETLRNSPAHELRKIVERNIEG